MNLRNLVSNTSVKIFVAIFSITTIVLAYISIFTITTAQNEFDNATIRFIDGNLFLVKQSPVAPVEVIKKQFNQSLLSTTLFAGFMALVMALVISVLFSLIITQPLRQLKLGISDLKKSKFKNKLKPTGEVEFDKVIKEFNELANELEYQETLRKDLISDVAHELKTPIAAVSSQLQGMVDGVLSIDNKRLNNTLSDLNRLNNLVDLLYEYTNLRTKFSKLEIQKFNIYNLVTEVIESFSATDIKIINNIEKTLVLNTDKSLLQRVIFNIIDNAIKYSNGDSIEIYNSTEKITISDNGVGIEEEHLKKIFERFYRVEKSRNRKTGGLGLGLSIAKEIVESLGWEIEAINNKENSGISFSIKFK